MDKKLEKMQLKLEQFLTNKQLNTAIRNLWSEIYRMSFQDTAEYFSYIEKTAKPEFIRLYDQDRKFERMNLLSVKIMLRLNIKLRVIAFHQFGNQIEITL